MLRGLFKRNARSGVLAAIYTAPEAAAAVSSHRSIDVLAGQGLSGDRYAEGKGFYQRTDACEVTIIDGEAIARAERASGVGLTHGEHRRNLVVKGLSLSALEGRRFRIGPALFEYHKPRPPCGHLESITEPGIMRALKGRFGACVRVLEGGTIRVGDRITRE